MNQRSDVKLADGQFGVGGHMRALLRRFAVVAIILCMCVVGFIVLIYWLAPSKPSLALSDSTVAKPKNIQSTSPSTDDTTQSDDGSSSPLENSPAEPKFSGVFLHPYDVVQNPYRYKGQLVGLEINTMPILYNGSVVNYGAPMEPRMGTRLGLMGLRFSRMLSEDDALYDVLGLQAGTSEPNILGMLLVKVPSNSNDLNLGLIWIVEPLGVEDGTNGFGAEVHIPYMRFVRYQGAQDAYSQ